MKKHSLSLALKVLFLGILFCGLERFCYWQTQGFRQAKIHSLLPLGEAPPLSSEFNELLNQPLTFLGSSPCGQIF
jgi:hypothetical protein